MGGERAAGGGIEEAVPGARPVQRAVARVFRDGLTSGHSAFCPELEIWTAATARDLRERFVDQPDASADTFLAKLGRQLAGAPDATVLLAAELLYVNLVPLKPEQIGIARKEEILAEVLSWAGRPVTLPGDLAAALPGFINGGQGFLNYRWAQFQLLVLLVERLTALPPADLGQVLTGPWDFRGQCRDVLAAMGHNKARSQVHVLQALLFPGVFLPIASGERKRDILAGYRDLLPESAASGDEDRDLVTLYDLLSKESGGPVNFFAEPWVSHWQPAAPSGGQRGWLVRGSKVGGRDFLPAWLAGGYCSTSWREVGELPAGASRAEIQHAVAEGMPEASLQSRGQATAGLHAFLTQMRTGDIVVTVSPDEVHVGRVSGDAVYDPSEGPDRARRRPVDWRTAERPLARRSLTEQVQAQLQRPPTVYDISTVAAELAQAAGLDVEPDLTDVDATRPLELPPVTQELADELLMPAQWLRDTARLLEQTRQLILYGPPGTGKTYLARHLARHLAGPDRVRLVQFHPSYTYEDFFEGFRPVKGEGGTVAFEVVPGPFRLLVDRARQDPGNPYVLVIDEINRANLAKVFGELYFLLEYRDEPIVTQYSPEREFDLPKNVFLIGTMNTADRSIALIDAAMRRRFAFRRLAPDRPPVAGLLRRWLAARRLPEHAADLLDALNSRLADPDRAIGPSYLMTPRVTEPEELRLIWESRILPLLEDQLHGTGADVEEEYGLAALGGPPPGPAGE